LEVIGPGGGGGSGGWVDRPQASAADGRPELDLLMAKPVTALPRPVAAHDTIR